LEAQDHAGEKTDKHMIIMDLARCNRSAEISWIAAWVVKIFSSAKIRKTAEAPKLSIQSIVALPIKENGRDNAMPSCHFASLSEAVLSGL